MKKLFVTFVCLVAGGAGAGEPQPLDEIMQAFAWDPEATEITSEKVGEGLYVLFGIGGNIAVSVGEQGVLIVDDMFPEMLPKIEAAIRKIGGGPIDFAINTHWHFDHAQGNLAVGPGGTWIVAQSNSSAMMKKANVINMVRLQHRQEAYPDSALPVISYDDALRFDFNGDTIELMHAGPAHTTGDTAVLFRKHDAVHLGDVFNNAGYPYIDVDNGGGIDGMIAFCKAVLSQLGPNAVVIPGHGAVADRAALEDYVTMLETVRGRVAAMIADQKSLEEVLAAQPTADLDPRYGPESESLGFVDRVYTSLSR